MDKKIKILLHLPITLKIIDTGAKRRILGFINYFKNRDDYFSIDIVCKNDFMKSIWTKDQISEIAKYATTVFVYQNERNLIDFLYSRTKSFYYQKVCRQQLPIDTDYHTPKGYVKYVNSILQQKKYDFIFINYIDYSKLAINKKNINFSKKIIDIHDIGSRVRLARKNISYLKNLQFNYSKNFYKEVALLNKFDLVINNSTDEVKELKPHLPQSKLCLIPHIVNNNLENILNNPYHLRKFKYDLLFIGAAYQPNIDGMNFFINSILPILMSQKLDIKIAVVGKVAEHLSINSINKDNFDCFGYVKDLSNFYLKSKIFICPLLHGSGTKVKIQEAMAFSLPIITTTVGASGYDLTNNKNVVIADRPTIFAKEIIHLLKNEQLAIKLATNISNTFSEKYSKDAVYSKIDNIFGI